jgi:hypothetical protein
MCLVPNWQGPNGFLRRRAERANTGAMRLASASAVLATALLGSAHAEGDALVDLLGPREIAVGEAMRGGATGASAIGMNPAGISLNRELVFEGGYGYRASDGASLIGVSACDSTATLPGCFFYDYAGANPDLGGMSLHRTTHVLGTALAYPITPKLSIGSTMRYFRFDSTVMDEPKASGFTWDLGATASITSMLNIGVAGYNLFGTDSVQFPRAAGGGVLARPVPSLAVSFDARWKLADDDHTARYGGGAEYFLSTNNGQTGFPIRAGVLHDNGLDTTYLSAGLGLATLRYGIDVTGRTSVSGPSDKMIIASMRFYGPRLRAPSPDGE